MTKTKSFAPMLSGKCPADLSTLRFPVMVSPKLDGIRCVIRDGVAMSRNLKPIPNRFVQGALSFLPHGLDGELIVGPPTGNDVWNRSQSGVMSETGKPAFTYHVFDYLDDQNERAFRHRIRAAEYVQRTFEDGAFVPFKVVPHHWAENLEQLDVLEERYVSAGYEGVMVRDPFGPYKFGRSTTKEGWLMKLKRFEDGEFRVEGYVEKYTNENEQTRDELGRAKRSSAKAGKRPAGTLGALELTTNQGVRFEVGTGFDQQTRDRLWAERADLPGQLVKVKYQGLTPDRVPRFPVFLGLRSELDT